MAHSEYDYIAWTDLETVGGDEHKHQILEVGVVVTTPDGDEITSYEQVVRLTPDGDRVIHDGSKVSNDILAMHQGSGLFEESLTAIQSIGDIDEELVEFLASYDIEPRRIILAGSGVGHFDQRFIRAQMPHYAKFLHYANADVGQMRRQLRLYGAPQLVSVAEASFKDGVKKHRALADAYAHLEEARGYMALYQNLILPAVRSYLSVPVHEELTQEQVWDFVLGGGWNRSA